MISALSSCSPKNSEDRVTTGEATVTQAETTDYSAVVRLTAQQAIEQGVVKVHGRYELLDDGAISCDWAGGGIEFNADTKGKVYVNISCSDTIMNSGGAKNYFSVWVDGERMDRTVRYSTDSINVVDGIEVRGKKSVLLAEDLAEGAHSFKIVRQCNPSTGLAQINFITFKGKFLDKPEDSDFLIEFIGDSLTAGQGVLGSKNPPYGDYSSRFEDGTLGYAYLAAEKLGADCLLIARPGIGLLCGSDKDNSVQMSKIYGRQCFWRSKTAEYTVKRTPDLIVYNLGTNDNSQGADPDEYGETLTAFLKEVSGFYGSDIPILVLLNKDIRAKFYGPTEKAIAGLENVTLTDYIRHKNGYSNHPNREDAVTEAQKLVDQIREFYPELCGKGNG